MQNQSIKNLFIAGLTLLSFGFLSAQFVIPSGIDNALQVIQRVLVTTNGMFSGSVVMDTNTGASNIYINPAFLPISQAYSGQYLLTVNASGYVSLTTGATNISGATVSGGNLLLSLSNGTVINAGVVQGAPGTNGINGINGTNGTNWTNGTNGAVWATGTAWTGILNIQDNANGTFTIYLSDGTNYTLNLPSGWAGTDSQTLSIIGDDLTISNGNTVDLWWLWFWSLLWNAWTNATINFLGTTDNQDLVFRTDNMERMRIVASGEVGIGTDTPQTTLNVSGSTLLQDNDLSFILMQNVQPIFWANVWVLGMQLNSFADNLSARMIIYDNRPNWDMETGISIATQSNANIPGLDQEASINSKNGENVSINVMSWVDLTNYDPQNMNSSWSIAYGARINMDADFINISSESAITVIPDISGSPNTYGQTWTNIDITPQYMTIYGSGGSGSLFFDSQLGRFWFSTWNPGNIVHIANSVNNTLWLRLSAMGGSYTNWVLWLNADMDVVPLAHISTLQWGGGWWPTAQYLKLGELDYTQLNSHANINTFIPLSGAIQLPANSLVTRVFVEIEPFAGQWWYRIEEFFLVASGTNLNVFDPMDWLIYGPSIMSPFWWYNTFILTFVPTVTPNPVNDDYSIYVRYSDNNTHSDWIQWKASFVVEYEPMPNLSTYF